MLLSGGVTCPPDTGDWMSRPLLTVQRLYEEGGASPDWEKKVIGYFQERLQDGRSCWVPSLNDVPLHYLKPSSLVRFRCMVQDMFDPEYYMGVYETVDRSNNNARMLHLGKYRDLADCSAQQEVDVNSGRTVTAERQTFYCVPVPGEASWAKEMYSSSGPARGSPSTSGAPHRHKRSHEDDDGGAAMGAHTEGGTENNAKKLEMEAQKRPLETSTGPAPLDLNFPLPGETGPACLVKVYEDAERYRVNDVLEVVGILSVEPALSVMAEERDSLSSLLDPVEGMDTIEEQRVHSPPTSLVPRLHAIVIQKLHHLNPLIPSSVCETTESQRCLSGFLSEVSSVRAEVLGFLTHALLGDGLAAEYLLLHLISTVYARRDVLPLGKFSLNISGCPGNGAFTQHLYRVLQQLVPASYYLAMTIENMNTLRFIPRKDYTANRLVSGVLQLSSHSSLMVDETLLQQGQLDANGVRNVTALGNVITWQKVDYDFSYHQMEFPCNINVLVTSEGRSLLPSDCQVQLKPQIAPPNMEEYMGALLSAAPPPLLNKFRIYLTLLRLMEYSISEDVTKAVEDDFVEMRKDDPQSMSADDLHRLLVVARLMSLSAGHTTLSRERWLRAKELEIQRKSRLQDHHSRFNGNEL